MYYAMNSSINTRTLVGRGRKNVKVIYLTSHAVYDVQCPRGGCVAIYRGIAGSHLQSSSSQI